MINDDMRDLFFIIKGDYKKIEPHFTNIVSGDVNFVGGYDPYSNDTTEWYMLIDNRNYYCVSCCGDLNKLLNNLCGIIKSNKGSYKKYSKHLSSAIRPAPVMQCLYERVCKEYGDYYSEEVQEIVEKAYGDLKEETLFNKTKKLVTSKKSKLKKVETSFNQEQSLEILTPKKLERPKVKIGVKRLPIR